MDLPLIQDFLYTLQKKRYMRYLFVIALCALLSIGALGVYSFFVTKKAQEAQKAFSQALVEFEKNVRAEGSDIRWQEVIATLDAGHERYAQTPLGPYFLAYKAQALVYDNKLDAALEASTQLMSSIKKNSPLFNMYATQHALMQIDSSQAQVSEQGVRELEALAADISNLQRDWAAYELGAHFLAAGNQDKAKQVWTQLVARSGANTQWSAEAQKGLASLVRAD